MTNIYNSSTTASSNTSFGGQGIDGSVDAPSNFDDALRDLIATLKATFLDDAGKNTVGGSANAITITPTAGSISALEDGLRIAFIAGSDNTSTSVMANVGGTGAEPVKKALASSGAETALAVGDIQSGGMYGLRWRSSWDTSNGAWQLIDLNSIVKTGVDANVVSGTAGTDGNFAQWNSDGDLVNSKAVPTGNVVGTTDSQFLTNKTLTSPVINTGVSGTAVLDEDTMSSNSATQLATQQSIKAYVDANFRLIKRSLVSATDSSWALQSGTRRVYVEALGGGGGGGGADSTGTTTAHAGGGGGSGAFAFGFFAPPGSTLNLTVGAGGAGNSGANGNSGGNTVYADGTNTMTAGGGGGGFIGSDAARPLANLGGSGGSHSGDGFGFGGQPGLRGFSIGDHYTYSTANEHHLAVGGAGGSSIYGGGGIQSVAAAASASTQAGNGATARGAGGSGACSIHDGAAVSGGTGNAGLIIVWEYI